jgi:predicted dehydrogenase
MSTNQNPASVGIVGLGMMGQNHAENVIDLGHEICGGVDVDPDAREEFAAEYDVPTYESPEELYEGTIDAVVITTPNCHHEAAAVPAFEADVNVLLEKPLAHTVESAERIVAAERDADAFGMVGFHSRFLQSSQVLTAYDDDGVFGEITHIEANQVRRRGVPARGSWFTQRTVSGGGALIDVGVHSIDLALHILGHPDVLEVSGITRQHFGHRDDYTYLNMWGEDQGPGNYDVEDSATAFIRCADDKTIALEIAWAANREENFEFFIRGDQAGARLHRRNGDISLNSVAREGTEHFVDTDLEFGEGDAHREEMTHFLDAVVNETKPELNTLSQALTVQHIVDAIYESGDTGEAVTLRERETEAEVAADD